MPFTRLLATAGALVAGIASAQPTVYELEPNDTPAEATRVSGPVVLAGAMKAGDQDGFLWSVSDVDAQKRWSFELEGIPGVLTVVDVLRLEYADNGTDVSGKTKLVTLGSRDGSRPALLEDVLFEPGEYLLGVAHAGGGGGYRPPVGSVSFAETPGGAPSASDGAPAAGYRLTIVEGSRLVLDGNPQPRPSKERARRLRPDSAYAAFTADPVAWYALTLDETQSAERWEITGQLPIGRQATAFLRDAAGAELARTTSDRHGAFAFRDLGLPAGTTFLEVRGSTGGFILAVAAHATGTRIEGAEAEPNDAWNKANRADLSAPVSGRIGTAKDPDYFSFTLGDAAADRLVTFALETAPGASLQLCLLDARGRSLQCRERESGVTLADLVLAPGEYGLLVARGSPETPYSVRMTAGAAIEPGVEAEPNDRIESAGSLDASNRVRGRFDGPDDVDFHRLVVTDDPQLWRFQVVGDNVGEVAYHDGAGIQNVRVRPPREQRRVRLENVFLLPGEHYVSVSGHGEGEYTLLARAIGPPDPNGEREPNDDATRMQLLRVGQPRTGLLTDTTDQDNYRFFLAHWDHIRLTVTPPADGAVQASLYWDTTPFRRSTQAAAGQPLVLEGVFPPGDYRLALSATTPSEAEYRLSLDRENRFTCRADCEPNDNPAFASPVPPSLVVEGRTGEWRDADWWVLPLLERESELLITSAKRRDLSLVASLEANARNLLQWDAAANGYRALVPAARPAFLQVKATASRDPEYRLELKLAAGPVPAAPPAESSLAMALVLDTETVGAYLNAGQAIHGRVTLEHGDGPENPVELTASSSDTRWRVDLERAVVDVSPTAPVTVAVTVRVPPDAWADVPVRISVRARERSGAQRTAEVDVTAHRDAAPVNPVREWAIPAVLRGGFNAAWQVLGARRVPDPTEKNAGSIPGVGDGFDFLFDGMAVKNQGLALRGGQGGLEAVPVTVALAGEGPVPVAGFAFTALGFHDASKYPRDVVLQLSADGDSFEAVATATLDPVPREQFVVLQEPHPARYARLLLDTNWEGRGDGLLGLGEWKVIAMPGVDVSGSKGFDLASPPLGGHVVWARPAITSHWDTTILTEREDHSTVRVRAGDRMEWVVGFHHNRAARIERLEWIDVSTAPEAQRIGSVVLAVSLDSPVGPWQPIGAWTLPARGGAGELVLDEPVWARYVKFSTPIFEASGVVHAPDRIRIWEQPTAADGYVSILTEWGDGSQEAWYEALQEVETRVALRMADNTERDRAAALDAGVPVSGEVELGRQEHWYRLAIPPEHNALTLRLAGDPTVRTEVHLETASGEPVPLRKIPNRSTPREHVLEAIAPSGSTVFARVTEPPRNVLFLWDTSASVGAYLPVIYNSLLAYAEDLVPGRDAANFLPFGSGAPLLRDWYGEPYILQTVLNDYPRKENSSEAERTLHTAARALAPRPGTKAIVMVTDAATNRYAAVWDAFEEVRPRIFALGVSSAAAFGRDPPQEQDLMQNWSRVNGGHYAHLLNEGEMEVAFDRAATLLRRPAPYTLLFSSEARTAPGPGRLTVTAGGTADASRGAAIELILDASGSMLQRLGNKRRIEIAKEVLTAAVSERIPAGTPVAFRVFGHRQANACRTDLEMPLAPLDRARLRQSIQGINAMNLAKTPIADSLAKVEADLKAATGRRIVVLVTDGEETCDGDPGAVIRSLQDKGIDVTLNIVGFAIDDADLEAQFRSWAELGNGRYLSARDEEGLSAALRDALQTPYTVYDAGGAIVARGLVGGDTIELAQGYYRVEVQASPAKIFERVEVTGESTVTLTLD